ncbi:MAG: DNA polymerase domain-containing protein [Candidatus Aenigmatarchaeota archaeon]
MQIQILGCDYTILNNKPLIRLFGKAVDGSTVCVFYDKLRPYFYVHAKESDFGKIIEELKKSHEISAQTEEMFLPIGYREKPVRVLKITGNDPSKVPEMREITKKYGTPYEADILFIYRFMADHGLVGMGWAEVEGMPARTSTVKCRAFEAKSIKPVDRSENIPLRYLALDIECITNEDRMPEPDKDPIIMISLRFSQAYKGKQSMAILAKPIRVDSDCIECVNEEEMLKKLLDVIKDYDPDVLIGYNINNFDMPYLLKRMEALNVPRDFGRTEKRPFMRKIMGGYVTTISGRVIVDPFEILKRDPWVSFRRYNLATVAREMLGMEKMDVGGPKEMRELWNSGFKGVKKIVDYCRKDSELALRLVLDKGMLDKFFELSKVSGLLLQDIFGGQAQRHENKILHEFKKRKILMPCRPDAAEISKRRVEREKVGLTGALVLDPIAGLHASGCTLVLDFQSLYPSIINLFNICPTTILLDEGPSDYIVTPYGTKFVKKETREGVLPKVIREMIDTRIEVKKQIRKETDPERTRVLNAKQLALKTMANSLYGYTGYMRSRLYVMDIANSITSFGRENIMKTKKLVEDNHPVKVLYGDSVTAERFVTVMDESGTIRTKNIEELFNEFSGSVFNIGPKEAARVSGYKALTVDPKTHTACWMPIKKVIRHKTDKKVFRVVQKFGETAVTQDHSIMTLSNGELEETRPEDMGGRRMIRVEGIPRGRNIKELDLFEHLCGYRTESLYKGRQKTAMVHTDGGLLYFGWMNRKEPVMLKRMIHAGTPEMEALCRLIGAYVSEGSSSTPETTESRMGASIASSDIKWLKQLKEDYKLLFRNCKASIIPSMPGIRRLNSNGRRIEYKDNTHKLQVMNSLAAVFFKMLCGQRSDSKYLPDFVFNLPERYQRIVLDNMVLGDGSRKFMNRKLPYTEQYKRRNFSYTTKSLRLASGFSLLLTLLGMKYSIKYREPKKAYTITTTTKHNAKVITKTIEEPYEGHVYDLEVEGSHMFVDSCGQVLLHNTDSIFIKTNILNLDLAEQTGNEISGFVTERLPGLKLSFERIFRTFLILTKKRYAGWAFDKKGNKWKDRILMKGIETIRRDWCELTSDTMKEVLEIVLKEQDINKASQHVRAVLKDLANGKVPLEKLTVVKGITKSLDAYDGIQPHVELAKKIRKRDPTRQNLVGERLGYVIIKGNDLLSKRAEDPKYVKERGLEIDSQYYIENQVLPPLERIFEACNITRTELLEGCRQKSLMDILNSRPESPENTTLKGSDGVSCKKCRWFSKKPPLSGSCPECGSQIYFSYNGSLGKFVDVPKS